MEWDGSDFKKNAQDSPGDAQPFFAPIKFLATFDIKFIMLC